MYLMPRRFLVTLAIAGIALCYTIQTHAQRLLTFSSLEFFGSTDPISPQSAIAALAQWGFESESCAGNAKQS